MEGKYGEIFLFWQTGSLSAQYAVLLNSKALKDHPIIECLRSANIIIADEETEFPENLQFEFCTILVHQDSTYRPAAKIPIYEGLMYLAFHNCARRIIWRLRENNHVHIKIFLKRIERWTPKIDTEAICVISKLFALGTHFCQKVSSLKGVMNNNANQGRSRTCSDIPLDFSIDRKCFPLAEQILNSGADVNARSQQHENGCDCPIIIAARTGSLKMVRLLLRYGACIGTEGVLYAAAMSHNLDVVKLFLSRGVSVNDKDPKSGDTALHAAKKPEIARFLIANGADVNARNADQRTPLHMAVESKNSKVVQILLDSNADINAKLITYPYFGMTKRWLNPLALSSGKSADEVTEILMKFGAYCEFEDAALMPNSLDKLQAFFDDICSFTNFNIERRVEVEQYFEDLVSLLRDLRTSNPDELKFFNEISTFAGEIATQIVKIEAAFNSEGPRIPSEIVENLKLLDFKLDCGKEIERLKLENVEGTSVPWFKILTGSLYFVSCLVRDKNIAAFLNDDAVYADFPLYGAALKSRVSRGSWRRQLLNEGMRILGVVIPQFKSLPWLLKENIVNELTNQEILNFESCFNRKQLRSNVGLPYYQKYPNDI